MTSRRKRITTVTLLAVILSPLVLLFLLIAALTLHPVWGYWLCRMEANGYIAQIEQFKSEHGFYPDPRTQTIVPWSESSPYRYDSDGREYCVSFTIGFDDDNYYCTPTREWIFGEGINFEWPEGSWPPIAAPDGEKK
jgi:hypothetical protein